MNIAPLRNKKEYEKPWEGEIKKKPWEYEITAIIPVIDTWEPLELVIKLLKLQTVKPYIIIVDTGSTPENRKIIENFQDESTEVHSLRLNSVQHPSDFVAMALDTAAAMVRTDWAFYTHADCFLKKPTCLEELLKLGKEGNPVVGYRISPRKFNTWEKMFGHTYLLLETKTYLEKRVMWNLKLFEYVYGFEQHFPNPDRPGFPDTETMASTIYDDNNVKKLFIGDEDNFRRNINEHFDHCRTFTSGMLYSPEYYEVCKQWMEDAMRDARQRIKDWSELYKSNNLQA